MRRRIALWMVGLALCLASNAGAQDPLEIPSPLTPSLSQRVEDLAGSPLLRATALTVAWAEARADSRMRCREQGPAESHCTVVLVPPERVQLARAGSD